MWMKKKVNEKNYMDEKKSEWKDNFFFKND